MLKDIPIKSVYTTEEDNILEDFYIPTLQVANKYQRSVGYFSAATLTYAAQALSVFVNRGGTIELIVGAFVSEDDFSAIEKGYKKKEVAEQLGNNFIAEISDINSDLFKFRIDCLSWLVANKKLEVKVAVRKYGLFHEKVGIISDQNGDAIVFSGSANETDKALLPEYNFESIDVFPTWNEALRPHWEFHQKKFLRLWSNGAKNTAVIDFPDAAKEKLVSIANDLSEAPSVEIEKGLWRQFVGGEKPGKRSKKPIIPDDIDGNKFEIREHQTSALNKWRAHDFEGILALATGAGKTITSIYGITQLSQKIDNLVVVIAVPYQNLADQWCEVLGKFNIFPIRCYRSRDIWEQELIDAVHGSNSNASDFLAIVVVNRTLKSDAFQKQLNKFDPDRLMLIGDECHHHGSNSFIGKIPLNARFRLGLSATPEHYLDDERNINLEKIYGTVVDTYTLSDAVRDKILTPYEYHVIPVDLTADEADEYVSLSVAIGRQFAAAFNGATAYHENGALQALLRRRSRIVASAHNKLVALSEVLDSIPSPIPHSLFYCGDGTVDIEPEDDDEDVEFGVRQIAAVSRILKRKKWSNSQFTARESASKRDDILENFKNQYVNSMVAIKCLDEGIDIPACSCAFILASSRDPRQFIQRRGRILRRYPGKEKSIIYDFIVNLPGVDDTEKNYARRLMIEELKRVAEFSSLSLNKFETYDVLRPILLQFDLEHLI